MPHVHHGASESFGPVLATAMLIFCALVYLRGWFSLRSNSLGRVPPWRAGSFPDRAIPDLDCGGFSSFRT